MTAWRGADLEGLKRLGTSLTLFLDDGGVLNDNALRAPEWLRLIGEFMPPRMGGTAEQWADANRTIFPGIWDDLLRRMPALTSHRELQHAYATEWMRGMCSAIGIAIPPDDEAEALYRDLSIYVAERASAAIPGAADVVLALHRAGYLIHCASGAASWELRGILRKMGITGAVSGLYGPDLVDHVKHGPDFYRKVFAHAGVVPDDALVIDSDAEYCRWATEAGAQAIWIDMEGRGDAPSLEVFARALV